MKKLILVVVVIAAVLTVIPQDIPTTTLIVAIDTQIPPVSDSRPADGWILLAYAADQDLHAVATTTCMQEEYKSSHE